ncbi:MAG: hypothetical protein J0G96_06420 [Flavobacteriia bacterium]|nr:hypothetical protein [Flavobacteriia bacterium]OJX36582.1 MAG: hypothetical protein BGO87_12330 [Flavobacteriia bacterium 40-80]
METDAHYLFIDDIHFIIDRGQMKIVQQDNKENNLSISDIPVHGEYYKVFIDRDDGSLLVTPKNVHYDECPDDLKEVTIPKSVLEERLLEASTINQASYENNWNIYIADEAVMERLRGKLPEIDIYGDQYYIDWKLKELRHTKNLYNRICIDYLDISPDRKSYIALFNKQTKTVVQQLVGNENPENMVFVYIPYELKLDPVAVARRYGLRDTALLQRFPIEKDLKATVVEMDQEQRKELKEYLKSLPEPKMQKRIKRTGKRKMR